MVKPHAKYKNQTCSFLTNLCSVPHEDSPNSEFKSVAVGGDSLDPNIFHMIIMETTELLRIINQADLFSYPDLCLATAKVMCNY